MAQWREHSPPTDVRAQVQIPASTPSGAWPNFRLVVGKWKESLQLGLRNLNSTSNSPVAPRRLSCQISTNQREAETSANVNKN